MKLVWDQSDCTLELGDLTIQAAPRDYPPFHYQAIVQEQDTNLLLSEQTTLREPGKPAWYLANTLERTESYSLGTIILKGHDPKRLLAIVHDIEQTPTCSPEVIKLAYNNLFKIIETKHISSLAIPLLGTVYGKLRVNESIDLLRESLQQDLPACLNKVWLILPEDYDCSCLKQLSLN